MSLTDWIQNSTDYISEYGVKNGSYISACELSVGVLRQIGSRWNYGNSIYSRDWGVLINLDGCRVDALQQISDEYNFLPSSIPTFTSLGSHSYEWHLKNFVTENEAEVKETTLITGNPFSRQFSDEAVDPNSPFSEPYDIDEEQFYFMDEVWTREWDDEIGTIPPRPITDSAINFHRQHPSSRRLIVHYMQPHIPFRNASFHSGYKYETFDEAEKHDKDTWIKLRDGDIDPEQFWEAYKDNLRWVLNDVELLLKNLDAETVIITADHGNSQGEWGIYGHPHYVPTPSLKQVPWIVTTATDTEEYTPNMEVYNMPKEKELSDTDVQDRLADLGYV